MTTPVLTEIVEQVKTLPDRLQYQVLSFVRTLRTLTQNGTPGIELLQFAGSIPAQDVKEIRQAIETGCEQVDWNEW
ncbi:MAG: hypothetical protein ISS57_15925 [Anaerolineales bacterium]|nr:hypothetical protein [Chloroflexota bacterium]MBL7164085.1 hypothetical protein [Anaerolineales bacterium]